MAIDDVAPRPAQRVGLIPRRLLKDERLAHLAAAGDTAAFEAIFERYHQELYRYCRAILSNHDEAQDALQSTMAAALRALPGEHREIALRPWLYRVAHNEAITIARRRADASLVHESHDGLRAQGADSETADRERLRELVADLRSLPERQRGALVMRELSDLDYAEIGAAIASSEAAARQLVYEAREALRESERGRELDCVSVREAISQRDGRVLRGRALRAHLRNCEGCQDFRTAISVRRGDLQAIAPAMPAAAAAGLMGAILGGTGNGGAGAGLGAAGSAGGMAAAGAGTAALGKGGAMVAAVVLGTGAIGGATGAIDLPGISAEENSPAAAHSGTHSDAAQGGGRTGTPNGGHGAGVTGHRDHSRGAGGSDSGAANGERAGGEEHSSGTSAPIDSESEDGILTGEDTGAGEQGAGGQGLTSGHDHALPENAQGGDPPGAAVGNPHTSSTGSAPLAADGADEDSNVQSDESDADTP